MDNCICIDVDDPVTLLRDETPRARLNHVCMECGDLIPAGRMYRREVYVFDGRLAAHKTCARCSNVRDEYFNCGWYYGRLVEDFRDAHDFDYRDGIPADFAPCKGRD